MDAVPECTVAKVLTYRPLALSRATTLAEVGRIFAEWRFDCVPVAEDGALIGIVTKPAVLRALDFGQETSSPADAIMERPVEAVMTRSAVRVRPDTRLSRALQIMAETRCNSLPVTIGALLIGIVTRGDVLRARRPVGASSASRLGSPAPSRRPR